MTDITKQVEQEEIAKAERDKYSHLLDAVPGGIAVFNIIRGGAVTINYFNDEICKLTGYTREEILARGSEGVCQAIPEDMEMTKNVAGRAMNAKEPTEIEFRSRIKNGELRYFRARIAVEETSETALIVYIAYTDITVQKKAEAEITSEMAYLTSVRDNKLLAKCRANITRNIIDNYEGEENTDIFSNNSNYTEAIYHVAGLCTTNQMEEAFCDCMMPGRLWRAYEEGTRETSLDYLRRMQDGTVLWVRTIAKLYADPETQDVMSFMYTYDIDQEKTMQLIVDHVTETEFDMLSLLYTKSDLLHCVRASEMEDNMNCGTDVQYSTGLPEFIKRYIQDDLKEEVLQKLTMAVKRFWQSIQGTTAFYQGTGLGLAICKNLVDMMGGTITVNNIEGVGSEFTVNIALDVCDDEKPAYLPADIPFEKLQALVVDDDVIICEHTQGILREMGMRAEWVSSGQQAVSLIKKKTLRQSYFNIVLLDWKMPDMDGIETAREFFLKRRRRKKRAYQRNTIFQVREFS